MKKLTLPAIVLGLVLLSAAASLADGDIYVGGPWGTRITSLPYPISAPGSYYLGSNLTYAGTGDGITIAPGVNHVTLDLMGFSLNGSGSGRYGIYLNVSRNVEIRNGTVTGWGTGIRADSDLDILHRIINVRVVGNNGGIFLSGRGHLVKGCEVTASAANNAIFISKEGTVSGCTVKFGDYLGINTHGGIISDNVVTGTGSEGPRYGIVPYDFGTLIKGNQVSGCVWGLSCTTYGVNVIGNTVYAASGAFGIGMFDDYSNLLDQNTVTGNGTHYSFSSFSKAAVRNNY